MKVKEDWDENVIITVDVFLRAFKKILFFQNPNEAHTLVSQDAGLSAHWPGFPFVFQGRCILSDRCTVTDRLAQTSST